MTNIIPWTVLKYVEEEVTRQGHSLDIFPDGGIRVGWMLYAWEWAVENQNRLPELQDFKILGQRVEKVKNAKGFRNCYVMVGMKFVQTTPEQVYDELIELEKKIKNGGMTPLDIYRAYEEIHPFEDGNGRSGKIILNWLNKSLSSPIFPPDNFWGRPIRNP